MPRSSRRRAPLIALILTALVQPGIALADTPAADLAAALKGGGYVIYFRHAQTEQDYADQVTADPKNCATQRVLSRDGWAQARDIGAAFTRLDIPVAEVISSEYCRAWQTADLAFGAHQEDPALNFEPAETYTDVQMAAMQQRVTPLILAPLADPAANRVIVGHDDPFEAVTGIYPEPQGVAYILRTTAGKVEVVGSIAPDVWSGL